jgi:hypothetical protein
MPQFLYKMAGNLVANKQGIFIFAIHVIEHIMSKEVSLEYCPITCIAGDFHIVAYREPCFGNCVILSTNVHMHQPKQYQMTGIC